MLGSGLGPRLFVTKMVEVVLRHLNHDKAFVLGKGAKKKQGKKLTSVSFAFTHTYTPVKTNIFPFFPKRTWKILKNMQKRNNLKQKIFCPMLPVVVSFRPSF